MFSRSQTETCKRRVSFFPNSARGKKKAWKRAAAWPSRAARGRCMSHPFLAHAATCDTTDREKASMQPSPPLAVAPARSHTTSQGNSCKRTYNKTTIAHCRHAESRKAFFAYLPIAIREGVCGCWLRNKVGDWLGPVPHLFVFAASHRLKKDGMRVTLLVLLCLVLAGAVGEFCPNS